MLDTKTHALWGQVMEVEVVDAASGEVFLETLANPQIPVTEGAFAVHGISDAMVADLSELDGLQQIKLSLRTRPGRG
ncbi:hypothetical protein [Streptomyces sp. NPDC004230]